MNHLLGLSAWSILWAAGGIWLARAAFRIQRGELLLVGLAIGVAADTLLANLLARVLPLPGAFWAAAALTALLGLGLALREGRPALWPFGPLRAFPLGSLVALVAISSLSVALGRGLAIFDDFAHLPVISLMAAGDIPPHFPLDPSVTYEYHYFILLFSAQLARLSGLYAWTALDLARGLVCGLALVLAFQWARRMTRSTAGGILGAAFIAFASGSRWLLLLLPAATMKSISGAVQLLGSGAGSGINLEQALISPWALEGGGPLAFPFTYVNGIYQPGVLSQFVANGLTETAFLLALLLTFNRWRGSWRGALASGLILSAGTLLTEAGVLLELAGWGLIVLITVLRSRSLRLPGSLWGWLGAVAGGTIAGNLLGGALLGAAAQLLGRGQVASHHTIDFKFIFPPTVVSAHLGVLSLANPEQAAAALAELGPLLLALPLLAVWGWKALRAGRWYEAVLASEAFLGLGMLFVQFTGSEGVRNTARLYRFMVILGILALPLGWNWAKQRGPALRWAAVVAAAVTLYAGLQVFGIALPAAQHPTWSYYLTELDSHMAERFWNRLAPNTLIFDPQPVRAPTVFGRLTDSNITWYEHKKAWEGLVSRPFPASLNKAGFSYAYLDIDYFNNLPAAVRDSWADPCALLLAEERSPREWRKLYDVRACQR